MDYHYEKNSINPLFLHRLASATDLLIALPLAEELYLIEVCALALIASQVQQTVGNICDECN